MSVEDLVEARYLGDSDILMPDLADRPRHSSDEHNRVAEHNAWNLGDPDKGIPQQQGPDPLTLVRKGDVILLDRWSADGRDDFEIVSETGGSEERVELFEEGGKWHWRRVAANNVPVAQSAKGYARKASAKEAAERENLGLPIQEPEPEDQEPADLQDAVADLVDASGEPVDVPDGGPAAQATPSEVSGPESVKTTDTEKEK